MGSIHRVLGIGVDSMGRELLLQHRLPGVELEDGEHGLFVGDRGRVAARRSSRSRS